MKHFPRNSTLTAGLIALVVCIVMTTTEYLFPEITLQATTWQVALIDPPTPHPTITLINLKPEDVVSCGDTTWNRAVLAQTITALTQAKAKFIAPMLSLAGPSSSMCGGASADAQLIEATTLSGKVLYPTSAFEPIKNQASGIGHLSTRSAHDGSALPLGLAIAQELGKDIPFDSLSDPLVSSFMKEPFSNFSFDTIWNLIQNQQWKTLEELVKDQIILIRPQESQAGLAQAHILNTTLTDSWVHPLGIVTQAFILFLLAFGMAWILLSLPNWQGLSTTLAVLCLLLGSTIFLHIQFGVILPFLGIFLGCTGASISASFLQAKVRRNHASAHILTLEKNLAQIHNDLMLKEQKSLVLMEALEGAQLAKQQSASKLEQVTLAQVEVDATRQQLRAVEKELHMLREQSAETEGEPSTLTPNFEALSVECQTFGIITKDPLLLKVFADIKKAAKSSNPILLLGETGTGKEVFAKAAHRLSDRAKRPFIPVNMAAIRPELFESELFGHVKGAFTGAIGGKGYVEAAEGGTLFLDEMGELSLDLQAKLLRLLESHTFNRVGEAHTRQANLRILVATNRDLKREVEQGRFREDLYYRLRSIVLYLPALRERAPEDRRLLAEHFLQQCAKEEHCGDVQISREALNAIISYSWPGNIRELKQTLSQAAALAETPKLTKADLRLEEPISVQSPNELPSHPTPKPRQTKKVPARDDATILAALRQHRFDMGATAQDLNCDRSTITQRLKGLGYETLVKSQGDFSLAAKDLANDESLQDIVEQKLREYEANLLPVRKHYPSVEEAITDCRRRFKNLPDRYLPSVEILIRNRFAASS